VLDDVRALTLRIAQCESASDFRAYEDLDLHIWQGGEREIVPSHILIAIARHGGYVLGAWHDRIMVGMALSFLGSTNGVIHHHLHTLGSAPGYRTRNIGYQLMMAVRELVIAQGLDLITWTFDPLESVNAHLYLHKLGATCRSYALDYYGSMAGLNAGLPNDRFLIEWSLKTGSFDHQQSIGCNLSTDELIEVPSLIIIRAGGYPEGLNEELNDGLNDDLNDELNCGPNDEPALIEKMYRLPIPIDIKLVKSVDLKQAQRWRACTRRLFTLAMAKGYVVRDYFRPTNDRSGFYLLERL